MRVFRYSVNISRRKCETFKPHDHHTTNQKGSATHMNRQQRRKLARQGIDHGTLKRIEDTTKRQAVQTTTNYAVACALLVLRDQFGFGESRAKRFMAAYSEVFADVTEGRLRFDDVVATIEDELKITFDVK